MYCQTFLLVSIAVVINGYSSAVSHTEWSEAKNKLFFVLEILVDDQEDVNTGSTQATGIDHSL